MERSNLLFSDQVCYRTVMHLCGQYGKPELAIRVLKKMLCAKIRPNAVTYGIYHHALVQDGWPSEPRLKAIENWRKIRLYLEVCTHFRERWEQSPGYECSQSAYLHPNDDKTSLSISRSSQNLEVSIFHNDEGGSCSNEALDNHNSENCDGTNVVCFCLFLVF